MFGICNHLSLLYISDTCTHVNRIRQLITDNIEYVPLSAINNFYAISCQFFLRDCFKISQIEFTSFMKGALFKKDLAFDKILK